MDVMQASRGGSTKIAISLSGGGVRSMLFCLGALRAVLQALERANSGRDLTGPEDALNRLTDVASVSGGSIASAYAFARLAPVLPAVTTEQFDSVVIKPAYTMVTTRSIMWSFWQFKIVVAVVVALLAVAGGLLVPSPLGLVIGIPVALFLCLTVFVTKYFTKGFGLRREAIYGLMLALLAGAAMFGTAYGAREAGLALYGRVGGVLLALLLVIFVIRLRGWALEQGMIAAMFPASTFRHGTTGSTPRLADIKSSARLVITATDLNAGQAIFLKPDGIQSSKWGIAQPGNLTLVRSARSSATFPGVFPALFLPRLQWVKHDRPNTNVPTRVALVDGGLYDNMGPKWLIEHTDHDTYLIVVNASGNLPPQYSGFDTYGNSTSCPAIRASSTTHPPRHAGDG
ncbi:MAG: hypothetical protein Q7R32_04000 [Dehalococcoidia bacterium]|nr:hypothetical protein [Dehalococcoidia bacterium]